MGGGKFRDFCARVSRGSSFTQQEVEAVINYATEIAREIVANGSIVEFGDLGTLSPSLIGKVASQAGDFSVITHIARPKVCFRASRDYFDLRTYPGVSFQRITPPSRLPVAANPANPAQRPPGHLPQDPPQSPPALPTNTSASSRVPRAECAPNGATTSTTQSGCERFGRIKFRLASTKERRPAFQDRKVGRLVWVGALRLEYSLHLPQGVLLLEVGFIA